MPSAAELRTVLDRFAGLRIGVLGDLMCDRFIYGDALRISPEAPVPVVTIRRRSTQPGGAANVANNVVSLGGQCSLFGALGDDAAGREVRKLLQVEGCSIAGIIAPQDYESTVKTRVVAQSQQLIRIDEEHTQPLTAASAAQLAASLDVALPQLSALVISDYAKGVLTPELAYQAIALCRARGVPVVVDPKPGSMTHYSGADVIKPNLGEALAFTGRSGAAGEDDMRAVCTEIRERSGVSAVVMTAGGDGVYVLSGSEFTHLPGHPRDVYDVAGAGDSVLAATALALAAGADVVSAAALGNLAGSLAVGHLGVAAVSAAEMRSELVATIP